jgi:indole-3-glycerol phosphate synthase
MDKPIFIAEIKTQSPFGFKARRNFASLMRIAIQYGDWISVHDNALWGGDFETISFVRNNTKKPILAKGFHSTDDDIKRALDHGADYVLVVDRVPEDYYLHDKCLFEWSSFETFHKHAQENMNRCFEKVVYNSRDLKTGEVKDVNEIQSFIDYRVPTTVSKQKLWVCQASNIVNKQQIKEGVSAYIVGESLAEFVFENCVEIKW